MFWCMIIQLLPSVDLLHMRLVNEHIRTKYETKFEEYVMRGAAAVITYEFRLKQRLNVSISFLK